MIYFSYQVEGEYYDTPKRLKECLNNELFKITKSSTSNSVILKKPCGCLLRFGKRPREPTIIDTEENFQQTNCACQRVTDWAQNWIKLPYCRRNNTSTDNIAPNKENLIPNPTSDRSALYATIDVSRKTRRRLRPSISHDEISAEARLTRIDAQKVEIDDGPLANYENLSFALSLEHYENAKDLLRRAGVTQSELNAITANLKPISYTVINGRCVCTKCGHPPSKEDKEDSGEVKNVITSDDYLMMEPNTKEQNKSLPAGYTPMSPIAGFAFHTLKHSSKSPISRLLDEKSASNPTLCGSNDARSQSGTGSSTLESQAAPASGERQERIEYRKRSSSADSSRFLEDVKEFEGSVGSRGSTSSIETLRNLAPDAERGCRACDGKHSDGDSSEASKGARARGAPAQRAAAAPGAAGGNRDSSSSNDSGVSSCSRRGAFELPPTTAAARRQFRSARRAAAAAAPRRSRSSGALGAAPAVTVAATAPAKSSSAEAEVPVLTVKPLRGKYLAVCTFINLTSFLSYVRVISISVLNKFYSNLLLSQLKRQCPLTMHSMIRNYIFFIVSSYTLLLHKCNFYSSYNNNQRVAI